jgi:futalosine hydrolase
LASRIGLISSVSVEGEVIRRNLADVHKGVHCGLTFQEGTVYDKSIVYLISGIGKTNASRGTTFLIEKFSPGIIINIGIGGAYPLSGLIAGDIAVAEKEIYGDEGVLLKDGFHTVETIGIPLLVKTPKKYFNEFPQNKKLLKTAFRVSRNIFHASNITVKSGPFLTLSTCTGSVRRAREIEKTFHAICENMEGAAVAHVCASCGIPMVEIRGISNIVGERNKKKWNISLAAENCQQVVLELLKVI